MSKNKLENAVVKQIEKIANSKTAQEAFIKRMKQNNKRQVAKEVQLIKLTISDIDKRASRQKIAYDNGITTLNDYRDDVAKNEEEKNELLQKLEAKQIELTNEEKIEKQGKKSILALVNFKKIWKTADINTKKDLLHSILEKVIVKGNSIELVFAHI